MRGSGIFGEVKNDCGCSVNTIAALLEEIKNYVRINDGVTFLQAVNYLKVLRMQCTMYIVHPGILLHSAHCTISITLLVLGPCCIWGCFWHELQIFWQVTDAKIYS